MLLTWPLQPLPTPQLAKDREKAETYAGGSGLQALIERHRSHPAWPSPVHGPAGVGAGAKTGTEEQVPSAARGFLNPETPNPAGQLMRLTLR